MDASPQRHLALHRRAVLDAFNHSSAWCDAGLLVGGRRPSDGQGPLLDKRAYNSGGPVTDNTTGASSFEGVPILPRVVGLGVSIRL